MTSNVPPVPSVNVIVAPVLGSLTVHPLVTQLPAMVGATGVGIGVLLELVIGGATVGWNATTKSLA